MGGLGALRPPRRTRRQRLRCRAAGTAREVAEIGTTDRFPDREGGGGVVAHNIGRI